ELFWNIRSFSIAGSAVLPEAVLGVRTNHSSPKHLSDGSWRHKPRQRKGAQWSRRKHKAHHVVFIVVLGVLSAPLNSSFHSPGKKKVTAKDHHETQRCAKRLSTPRAFPS